MNKKSVFYTEIAYVFGLVFLALGASLTERAGLGMSMVIAPPYLLYLKLSEYFPSFTFGMAAYTFQGVLIIVTILVIRKIKFAYFLSFLTAVIYGFLLDGINILSAFIPNELFVVRIALFTVGILSSTFGVAMMFKTYFPPEAYELIVKEITEKFKLKIHKVKLVYDVSSFVFSIILSFLFFGFGQFNGINIGTVISAAVNGALIGFYNKKLENVFDFKDKFKLRSKFI